MILVIDNYDSFVYNLVHYLQDLGAQITVRRNDELTTEQALDLKPSGIVLSPGPCTPNEAGICMDIVRKADPALPILGVCLGHQSICQAMGADVVAAKAIMHGKISTIRQSDPVLFANVADSFDVVRYHSLAVRRETIPPELEITAESEDGEVMAVRHVTRPISGLQFHPESIASQNGKQILTNFLSTTGES